jgi:hopene-associated glycosyltransferase HpnB
LAATAAITWAYLLAFRGGFWRAQPRLEEAANEPRPADRGSTAGSARWPAVVAVIPARNEAAVIGGSIQSILRQDYPGRLSVVVVDDRSEDGTAEAARAAAGAEPQRLDIVAASPLPAGWTGKTWAVHQGAARAEKTRAPEYLWLTDADIEHDGRELRRLVTVARAEEADLVSVMVMLRCESFWEKLLIPAFVLFFQKLYPFAWVNDPVRPTAAAAGGSMLVRGIALRRAGGIEAIRNALIDDCALARNIKKEGRIWLGLARLTRSLRGYDGLRGIWDMVARTAYTQLRHSPVLLMLSLAGLAVAYLVPPAAAIYGGLAARPALAALGAAGWLLMAAAYLPTLRLYGRPWAAALSLPFACLLYCAMTGDSARRHWQGRGGAWKGRAYAGAALAATDSEAQGG